MQVANNMAVSIHYTLTNDEGEVLDSSIGQDTLVYLHGTGNIISGLENAITGKTVGDKFNVHIAPEDAYGEIHEDSVQVISRDMFEGTDDIQVGMQFRHGPDVFTVVGVEGDNITIDDNHPLAGMALTFDVEIIAVRPASAEEIAHGHIHGEGGHHH